MKEIEVIASYNLKGYIKPHRFRLTTEDESLLVVNIDRILFSEKDRKGETIKYRCECVMHQRKKYVDIYFYRDKMKWCLKM